MILNSNVLKTTVVDAIRSAADPDMIVLFGSQATGAADEYSDIDLMVVQPREKWQAANRRAEISRLRRAISRTRYPIDLLLFTPAEIAQWRNARNHVVSVALRQGEILYERS